MLKDKEFLITVFGGWFGLHKYYEEEYGIGFLYMISFGLFGIDHIIPLSKNGMTTEENLQTLCWKCNRSKGSKVCDNTEIQL